MCFDFDIVGPWSRRHRHSDNGKEAYDLAGRAEVAFVDVNLIDGATGPEIGKRLAADGVTVVFNAGNPEQLGTGIEGTLGVILKPMFDLELIETVQYATDPGAHSRSTSPLNPFQLIRSYIAARPHEQRAPTSVRNHL